MAYDIAILKEKLSGSKEGLASEFRSISTGRASPSVLDLVYIEQYGAKTQVAHTASITIEDPRTLRVSPWDTSIVRDIEKAINEADLGLSVSSDEKGLRVHFPALTEESRGKLMKVVKEKLEDARVRVRAAREEANKTIDQLAKDGEFGEDEKKRLRDQVQAAVDGMNEELEELFSSKEREIMNV